MLYPLPVFNIAGQISGEEPLLVEEPPNQKRYYRGGREKSPKRTERQRCAEKYNDALAYIG